MKKNKNMIVILPILLVSIIILGCMSGGSSDSSSSSNDSSTENGSEINRVEEEAAIEDIQEVEEKSEDTVKLNIGDTATIDNLQITVKDYKFSDYADGEKQNKVKDGLKYCVVYMTVKNLDNSQKILGDSFKRNYASTLFYDNYYEYHSTWTRDPVFFFANDDLPALGEIDCIVTYEVSKDVEDNPDKELDITFQINNIWKDQETTTWLLREQTTEEDNSESSDD